MNEQSPAIALTLELHWQQMPVFEERQAVTSDSAVGGQGMVRFATARARVRKEGVHAGRMIVWCNSRCHPRSYACQNHCGDCG